MISNQFSELSVDQTPDNRNRGYAEVMRDQLYHEEKGRVERELADKAKAGELHVVGGQPEKKKGRWDSGKQEAPESENLGAASATPSQGSAPRKRLGFSALSADAATPRVARWDETPAHSTGAADATPSIDKWSSTPAAQTPRRNRWDETPKEGGLNDGSMTPGWGMETPARGSDDVKIEDTPSASKRRSRWDLTPSQTPNVAAATPLHSGGQTPSFTPSHPSQTPIGAMTPGGATPIGTAAMGMKTPAPHMIPMTPEQMQIYRWEKEIDDRNRPLTDEELESLFPPGYKVLVPPMNYIPLR